MIASWSEKSVVAATPLWNLRLKIIYNGEQTKIKDAPLADLLPGMKKKINHYCSKTLVKPTDLPLVAEVVAYKNHVFDSRSIREIHFWEHQNEHSGCKQFQFLYIRRNLNERSSQKESPIAHTLARQYLSHGKCFQRIDVPLICMKESVWQHTSLWIFANRAVYHAARSICVRVESSFSKIRHYPSQSIRTKQVNSYNIM